MLIRKNLPKILRDSVRRLRSYYFFLRPTFGHRFSRGFGCVCNCFFDIFISIHKQIRCTFSHFHIFTFRLFTLPYRLLCPFAGNLYINPDWYFCYEFRTSSEHYGFEDLRGLFRFGGVAFDDYLVVDDVYELGGCRADVFV